MVKILQLLLKNKMSQDKLSSIVSATVSIVLMFLSFFPQGQVTWGGQIKTYSFVRVVSFICFIASVYAFVLIIN